jgi:hypothetical protein
MNFLKNLFRHDPTAGPMEKFVTYFVPIVAFLLFFWLFGSAWQLFGAHANDISRAAHLAPKWSHVVGTILFFVAIFWAWWNWTEKIPFRVNDTAATVTLLLLLIFSVAFYCGFWIDNKIIPA